MTGLDLCLTGEEIEFELRGSVYDQISQKDLDATIILNSKTLIERDADFAKFAGRIQLTYIYEEVLGWDILRDGIVETEGEPPQGVQEVHRARDSHQAAQSAAFGVRLDRLAGALDPSSDLEFDFLGVQTLYDRYLIVDKVSKSTRRIETPQFFWMRVAMGLFLDEKGDRESKAAHSTISTRRGGSARRRPRSSTAGRCIPSCQVAFPETLPWLPRQASRILRRFASTT